MTAEPRRTAAAVRIYGLGLRLYSPQLHARYGEEMCATFAARADAARHQGGFAVARLLVGELADLVVSSFRSSPSERRRRSHVERRQRSDRVTAIVQDVRYALRMLRRQPAFAAVALVTLGLGIGATTAVFTVVNGVLLRPLPYADPDRIVQLLNGRNGRLSLTYSPMNYHDVTTQSGAFAESAALTPSSANFTSNGDPQQLDGANVTPRFFAVLGITPRYGRIFVDGDGEQGAPPVIILSDRLWRRQFGGRPDAIGGTIRLDGTPFTIVGIAPPSLALPAGADYWRPLIFTADNLRDAQRGAQWVTAIARLKPGVTLTDAQNAMAVVAGRLARDFPRTNAGRAMTAIALQERIVRGVRPALLVVVGAVTLVLLVSCVNVANLLLARANARSREVAVRAAVGAARGRLMQQFLVESLVLGIAGVAGGLVVAYWATKALVALGPRRIPRLGEVTLDWRVLGFAVALAMATSILVGMVPAFASTANSIARFVSAGVRGAVGHSSGRLRKVLVVAELALAVILLTGAGLLVRSFQQLNAVNPGFVPDHVLTFTISLPEKKYPTSDAAARFVADLIGRLARRPGIESAAAVFGLPLDDSFSASSSFTRPGQQDSADSPSVGMRIVTPEYFKTLKIALRRGRLLNERDDPAAPEVVVINEEAARRYWPGEDPIGKQLHLGVRLVTGVRSGQKTIVGVVGDVKYSGLDSAAPPEVYLPHAQHPIDAMTIVARTTGDPLAAVPVARATIAELDREMPMAAVRSMDEVIGQSIAERRFLMLLLGAFAAIAVMLAAIGVYGVLAYVVSQRTQEIGVRLAIGAAPADVVRLFLREGVAMALIGLLIGAAGAFAAGRALTSMLFGVTATDPATYGLVAAALAVAAFLASYVPARRAARVDPMEALRMD